MSIRRKEDVTAFSELVATRSPALLRTAFLVVGDHQLAQDLVQESLVKAYVAWPRLRDGSTNPQSPPPLGRPEWRWVRVGFGRVNQPSVTAAMGSAGVAVGQGWYRACEPTLSHRRHGVGRSGGGSGLVSRVSKAEAYVRRTIATLLAGDSPATTQRLGRCCNRHSSRTARATDSP